MAAINKMSTKKKAGIIFVSLVGLGFITFFIIKKRKALSENETTDPEMLFTAQPTASQMPMPDESSIQANIKWWLTQPNWVKAVTEKAKINGKTFDAQARADVIYMLTQK